MNEEEIRYLVRDELRKILDKGLMYSASAKPQVKTENILEQFPPELAKHLTMKDGKIYCEYVSKERWTDINGFAKDLGYEWVSAGKDSHWELKK